MLLYVVDGRVLCSCLATLCCLLFLAGPLAFVWQLHHDAVQQLGHLGLLVCHGHLQRRLTAMTTAVSRFQVQDGWMDRCGHGWMDGLDGWTG